MQIIANEIISLYLIDEYKNLNNKSSRITSKAKLRIRKLFIKIKKNFFKWSFLIHPISRGSFSTLQFILYHRVICCTLTMKKTAALFLHTHIRMLRWREEIAYRFPRLARLPHSYCTISQIFPWNYHPLYVSLLTDCFFLYDRVANVTI